MKTIGSTYEPCMLSVKETCGSPYEINKDNRNQNGLGYEGCKNHCNNNNDCKFIFHFENPNKPADCLIYRACDTTRRTDFVGSTYSKDGNCPGTF